MAIIRVVYLHLLEAFQNQNGSCYRVNFHSMYTLNRVIQRILFSVENICTNHSRLLSFTPFTHMKVHTFGLFRTSFQWHFLSLDHPNLYKEERSKASQLVCHCHISIHFGAQFCGFFIVVSRSCSREVSATMTIVVAISCPWVFDVV